MISMAVQTSHQCKCKVPKMQIVNEMDIPEITHSYHSLHLTYLWLSFLFKIIIWTKTPQFSTIDPGRNSTVLISTYIKLTYL